MFLSALTHAHWRFCSLKLAALWCCLVIWSQSTTPIMQFDSRVNLIIGCVGGVIALVTLLMTFLTYRLQCARKSPALAMSCPDIDVFPVENKNSLPFHNTHAHNGTVSTAPFIANPFWLGVSPLYNSASPASAWPNGLLVRQEHFVLPINPVHGHNSSARNGVNSFAGHSLNAVRSSVKDASSNPGASVFDATPDVVLLNTDSHHRSTWHKPDTGTHLPIQEPLTSLQSNHTVPFAPAPIKTIRSGQGGEAYSSLRLPADAHHRVGGRTSGIRRRVNLRYASRPFRQPNVASSSKLQDIRSG